MKTYKLKIALIAICISVVFVGCNDDDDNGNIIGIASCDDGEMNGDETGIDCGGSCEPCEEGQVVEVDFSATYLQEDSVGRPAVNTVFSGSDAVKNAFNNRILGDNTYLGTTFQAIFQETLEAYHDVYATALGLEPEDVDYETNVLGLDAEEFTTLLAAYDALQVAADGPTTYYDGTNVLTGRNLSDDVIDVSLTLMFGGTSGTRFDGADTNGDGMPDTPQLTSDGVGSGDRDFTVGFPYLEAPTM